MSRPNSCSENLTNRVASLPGCCCRRSGHSIKIWDTVSMSMPNLSRRKVRHAVMLPASAWCSCTTQRLMSPATPMLRIRVWKAVGWDAPASLLDELLEGAASRLPGSVGGILSHWPRRMVGRRTHGWFALGCWPWLQIGSADSNRLGGLCWPSRPPGPEHPRSHTTRGSTDTAKPPPLAAVTVLPASSRHRRAVASCRRARPCATIPSVRSGVVHIATLRTAPLLLRGGSNIHRSRACCKPAPGN
mmetsp:Transcript_27452/g.70561  ORF Transcript_27452/g.70561 Transcript_27452/m.70561 type:complete len:245 (+) Transcript_27452:1134-1868(+)